ncbi:integral membrane protein [Neisseria zoodegmatis]|uniref:Integral membrane protein n=2 Tax=Neisseria zoodegmatis TaxID=326523 RepID=A0AB38DPI6_9NEIS|nr:integral membrane protein [Neisseria zoodegmatis]
MMAKNATESGKLGKALKKYLITGVLVWLPIAVTLWVITYIVSASDQLLNLLPAHWQPKHFLGFNIPGLGVIVTMLALFITGLFGANVIGKQMIAAWDHLLGRIPVVKSIYSSVKKVSESLLSDNSRSFKTPVLVPFPQPDIWTIAFVSGSIPESVVRHLEGEEYVSVYVPTTPNPTGGYYIMVKKSDIRELDMSVDDALKYVISLGMVLPNEPFAKNLLEKPIEE